MAFRVNRLLSAPVPHSPSLRTLIALAAILVALHLGIYVLVLSNISPTGTNLCRWDCFWYLRIAEHGYDTAPLTSPPLNYGQANWSFFPAYSGLIALLHAMLHLPFKLCALIVSNIFFGLFLVVGARYLAKVRPGTSQSAMILFACIWPFSFYLSIPYAESLYALLTTGTLFMLALRRVMGAAILSALLIITRPTGLLIWPALAWTSLSPAVRAFAMGRRLDAFRLAADAMPPLALAPIGLTLFMLYLYIHVGDALAFSHIRAGWGQSLSNPFANLLSELSTFDIRNAIFPVTSCKFLSAVSAIGALALSVQLTVIGRRAEAWILATTVLLAASLNIPSMQRYALANPVMLIFLFDWLWTSPARRWLPWLILPGIIVQIYYVVWWGMGYAGLV